MTNVSESLKLGRVYEVRSADLFICLNRSGKRLSFGVPLWIASKSLSAEAQTRASVELGV